MPRRDLYAVAHKAMRNDLFEVSVLAGRTDFSEPQARERFRVRFDGLLDALRHHEQHEDDLLHPLLADASPDVLASVQAEHTALQAQLADVLRAHRGAHDDATGHAFYLALNGHIAAYLTHIDREERELMPAIQAAHDDAVLDTIARRDVDATVTVLERAAPAMLALVTTWERIRTLDDIGHNIGPTGRAAVTSAVIAALDDTDAAALRHALDP